MFGDLMSKLMDAKRIMADSKAKLSQIEISSEVENGKIKVLASADKTIKSIQINPELFSDAEALEELLVVALNKALKQAEDTAAHELKSITAGLLPGLDNML